MQSGAPWETIVGYSRAVRKGPFIAVSGTAPVDDTGRVLGGDDPYAQTVACIEKVRTALRELGADLGDVVRTRIFVTDIARWEAIARAHAEAFSGVLPATSMVEVTNLIAPGILVEVEADAIVDEA